MPIYRKCSICHGKVKAGTKCKCEIKQQKERYKEYNKRIRYNEENKKYSEFYNSVAWNRISKYIRIKYNGLCLMCLLKDKVLNPCDVVHHIEEIREDYDKRLEEKNLITLCHKCHNMLHSNYTEKDKIELKKMLKEYEKNYV